MTIVSAPTIWMYGGVHYDPGSRQRFLEELAKRETAPHFVAVEWSESVFTHCVARRPWIQEALRSRWAFLTPEDCEELARVLAWEGDAYRECFPDTEPLWLDTDFHEAYLHQPGRNAHTIATGLSEVCLDGLCNPWRPLGSEVMARIAPPPPPRSKQELIDCVSRDQWKHAPSTTSPADFERDPHWATMICERSAGLRAGWIAVVVGWAHAKPQADPQSNTTFFL